ncbi:MAG TPA: type I glutamate--ammonia ligase [Planctomycetota bacterium]|jgi:glutamine synthetase|nr:type I glutamate--ammonia ligase [Planctomycetota bacterium]
MPSAKTNVREKTVSKAPDAAARKVPAASAGAAERVHEMCRKAGARVIDLRFCDLFGTLQHFSISLTECDENLFGLGIGFDGSSIRGFQQIHESDMVLLPDEGTAILDPCFQVPTVALMCDVIDPITREPYSRDPRHVAAKAEEHLKSTGIADTSFWGPELEFFVFDHIRFDQNSHEGYYFIDSDDGIWNSGRDRNGEPGTRNHGYRPRYKEGYFPLPPIDHLQDFRSRAIEKMERAGIHVEVHHHEVATAGQCEIDMRYQTLRKMGDQVMLYKHILRNVAREHGKTVTFMPKPLFGDNGTGMHVHSSLWKGGKNLFYDEKGYALLSKTAMHYIGGLLKHGRAILALAAPTTNSYRRLVPGYEAPVNLVYSARNRSAAVRIPMYFTTPGAKRIEFRPPDPSSNAYLTFAAILMAGLDGIEKKLDPGEPLDVDVYELSEEEGKKVPQVPGSLSEALEALEEDHEFLLKGGVFTRDVLETWIETKRKREVDAVRLRPHPYEFFLYYDA